MDAVITAGGRIEGDFAREAGTGIKALAPYGKGTLLDRSIQAARGAGARRIAVVGGPEVRAHCERLVDLVIDADEDGGTNALRALAAWPGSRLLYLTSDLPFVGAQALRRFGELSGPYGLTMPLASEDAYASRFPGSPPHTTQLGGERVANGSAFAIAPEAVEPLRAWAVRFFAARKSKLRMAVLLGPSLLLRFALRGLTIAAVERHAQRVLGVRAAAIRDADPALCYDVDTLEDYRYACRLEAGTP